MLEQLLMSFLLLVALIVSCICAFPGHNVKSLYRLTVEQEKELKSVKVSCLTSYWIRINDLRKWDIIAHYWRFPLLAIQISTVMLVGFLQIRDSFLNDIDKWEMIYGDQGMNSSSRVEYWEKGAYWRWFASFCPFWCWKTFVGCEKDYERTVLDADGKAVENPETGHYQTELEDGFFASGKGILIPIVLGLVFVGLSVFLWWYIAHNSAIARKIREFAKENGEVQEQDGYKREVGEVPVDAPVDTSANTNATVGEQADLEQAGDAGEAALKLVWSEYQQEFIDRKDVLKADVETVEKNYNRDPELRGLRKYGVTSAQLIPGVYKCGGWCSIVTGIVVSVTCIGPLLIVVLMFG